jgi:hypothetical protein
MQTAPRFVFSAARLFTAQAARIDRTGDANATKENMRTAEEATFDRHIYWIDNNSRWLQLVVV